MLFSRLRSFIQLYKTAIKYRKHVGLDPLRTAAADADTESVEQRRPLKNSFCTFATGSF